MNHTVKVESLPEMEFLVIKGYRKLYDPGVTGKNEDVLRQSITNGSLERLKTTAQSETVYILFCNTCVRDENEKCYTCGYDIACDNYSVQKAVNEFEVVKLKSCEYVVYDCEFLDETTLQDAHEKTDKLFWNVWLKENPYVCAIDEPENWRDNGFAAIEMYTPLDPEANKFHAKFYYPILQKNTV